MTNKEILKKAIEKAEKKRKHIIHARKGRVYLCNSCFYYDKKKSTNNAKKVTCPNCKRMIANIGG